MRGGARHRLVGKLVASISALTKTLELPPLAPRGDVVWVDAYSGAPPTVGASVRYGLGDDIRRGTHTVSWRHGGRKPVWVRFVSTAPPTKVAVPGVRRIELLGTQSPLADGP